MPVTNTTGLDLEVESLLADFRPYHSELQIDAFITVQNGYGHPWGMYLQALREIHARRGTIKNMERDIARTELDVEEVQGQLKSWQWGERGRLRKRRWYIDLCEHRDKKEELVRNITDVLRELKQFVSQAHMLRTAIGGRITDELREAQDRSWWIHRIKFQIAQSFMRTGAPPVDLWEMMPGMPAEVRETLRTYLNDPQSAVLYYKQESDKPVVLVAPTQDLPGPERLAASS